MTPIQNRLRALKEEQLEVGEFYGNVVVVWQQKDTSILNGSHCGNNFCKAFL